MIINVMTSSRNKLQVILDELENILRQLDYSE